MYGVGMDAASVVTTWLLAHAVLRLATASCAHAHAGVYSGQVLEYNIVVPRKVTADGEFISYNLVHHHSLSHRRRRSTDQENREDAEVHYQLEVSGQQYHLELSPSLDFMSPALVVEERGRGHTHYPALSNTTCHYHGAVRGHPGSRVALSACHGLVGLVHCDQGLFWLEPVVDGGNSTGHSHMVFRRAATASEPKKKKRKKRRKHEKNCGTREPRRLTETRLEWKSQTGRVKVQGRGKPRRSRWRRSTSLQRNVEALLVADPSMMAFHRDRDVNTYFLTIMNMVSLLYLHPSIGNSISVVVVRIILLHEDDPAQRRLNVTVNADETLENFCTWQLQENIPDDEHPNHHDVAILVTREDICARQNAPCSTLGVAHVGGMCNPVKSCNVNEDNGISLAHTITHEMGHNFGMYHDTEKIGCSRRDGSTLHVMTPSFEADTVGVAWSRCSRRDITNFLDQGYGDCLQDKPSFNYSYPELPPGAMYDADHQCRLQFGNRDASLCSPQEEICSRLWCTVNGMCTTMLRPAAAGTSCGKHMWCVQQKCVMIGEKQAPIHGGWGDWGPWSRCSRTCGAGVSIAERHCDHPVPAFGGRFCIGERRRYKICNTEKCPEGSPSFRAVQCSAHDDQEYHGRKYKWLPYFDKDEPCELYCSDSDDSMIVPFGDSVEDGTPCNMGSNDMCIHGVCKKVGCDWMVDSNATEDQCGICHGDGSRCKTMKGNYPRKQGTGYEKVVQIPAGSRNIVVKELGNSRNFIGVGNGNGKFFLNGKRQITLADEYEIAGTPALYEREKDLESLHIPGPIKEDIMIYLIYRGKFRNYGLHYEYTVPKKDASSRPEYKWTFSDWSPCSATCGGGTQTSQPVCHEKGVRFVNTSLCPADQKPSLLMRACNDHPCPARWWTGPWQICSATCGDGARRKRTVLCSLLRQESGSPGRELALPDKECEGLEKPAEYQACPNLPSCSPVTTFHATPAPPALPTASPDTPPRHLDEEEARLSAYNYSVEQDVTAHFSDVVAPRRRDDGWEVGLWSACSVTCGEGRRTRRVTCVAWDGVCSSRSKPAEVEACLGHAHRNHQWVAGPWSQCSVSCHQSVGYHRRRVDCIHVSSGRMLRAECCSHVSQPAASEPCQPHHLCYPGHTEEDCKDQLPPTVCSKFVHLCGDSPYIRMKCCHSCAKR